MSRLIVLISTFSLLSGPTWAAPIRPNSLQERIVCTDIKDRRPGDLQILLSHHDGYGTTIIRNQQTGETLHRITSMIKKIDHGYIPELLIENFEWVPAFTVKIQLIGRGPMPGFAILPIGGREYRTPISCRL